MYIHEAIKAITPDTPCIVRKKWTDDLELGGYAWKGAKIYPTSSPDYCLVMSGYGRTPCRGWEPSKEDLMADDWEVCS